MMFCCKLMSCVGLSFLKVVDVLDCGSEWSMCLRSWHEVEMGGVPSTLYRADNIISVSG